MTAGPETLEALLDFLDCSSASADPLEQVPPSHKKRDVMSHSPPSSQCPPHLPTPHIDSVLSRYRGQPSLHLHPHPRPDEAAGYETRLLQLERQLSDLLQTSKAREGVICGGV